MAKPIRERGAQQDIIAAARRLVALQGVHATTMRGIALEAGVTTGAVTHHFADKADVMTSVLRYNNELVMRRIAHAVAGSRGLAALRATAESLLPLDEESMTMWTVLIAFWGHAPASRFIAEAGDSLGYLALREWFIRLLRDAVGDGEVRADIDVEHEAERVIALLGGIGLMVGGFPALVDQVRARARKMLAEQIETLVTDRRTG